MGDDGDDEADGNDDIVWERVRTALVDENGIRWDRAIRAVREEVGLDDLGLYGIVVALVAYLTFFTEETIKLSDGIAVVALFVGLAGMMVARSISDYYAHDEDVAIEKLRTQYAADEIGFEEFQHEVDRVVSGEDVDVFEDEAVDPGSGDSDPEIDGIGSSGGPVAILKERYARGEIDDPEYERRLAKLREDDHGCERTATGREFAFEE